MKIRSTMNGIFNCESLCIFLILGVCNFFCIFLEMNLESSKLLLSCYLASQLLDENI